MSTKINQREFVCVNAAVGPYKVDVIRECKSGEWVPCDVILATEDGRNLAKFRVNNSWDEAHADAQFFAHAGNCHDLMLEALYKAEKVIDNAHRLAETWEQKDELQGAIDLVRHAIHKAEVSYVREQPEEPEIDDTVHCCPDCERPNQFGEVCPSCEHEARLEAYERNEP